MPLSHMNAIGMDLRICRYSRRNSCLNRLQTRMRQSLWKRQVQLSSVKEIVFHCCGPLHKTQLPGHYVCGGKSLSHLSWAKRCFLDPQPDRSQKNPAFSNKKNPSSICLALPQCEMPKISILHKRHWFQRSPEMTVDVSPFPMSNDGHTTHTNVTFKYLLEFTSYSIIFYDEKWLRHVHLW